MESIGDSTPYIAFERSELDQAPSGLVLRAKQYLGAERINNGHRTLVYSSYHQILYRQQLPGNQ